MLFELTAGGSTCIDVHRGVELKRTHKHTHQHAETCTTYRDHSKFKNTGVLFELLVRQITLEVLNGDKTENAKNIVKEFFAPSTELNKELRLYDILLKEKYNWINILNDFSQKYFNI
mgnify:CR=1 FL=1